MAKTKPKLSVLVDTNILIRAAMQEQERKELQALINYSNEGKIVFNLSEIVIDEIRKQSKGLENTLDTEIAKVSKKVREIFKDTIIWNELRDLENFVVAALYQYKGIKYEQFLNFLEELSNIEKNKNTRVIKPDLEKFYETQRKITKGELPKINSNDIHILDTLEEMSRKRKTETIIFVTENKKDFFETDGSGEFIKNDKGGFIIKGLSDRNIIGFVTTKKAVSYISKEIKENEV